MKAPRASFTGEGSGGRRERSAPISAPQLTADLSLLNAVFSGGYYIAYYDEASLPGDLRVRTEQKRIRKKEEQLFFAQLAQHVCELQKMPPEAEQDYRQSRHARLMDELQAMILRSDLVGHQHREHVKHEIDVARTQLLRGGSFDDTILMQTLQEIAADQGFSLAGSSIVSGRFVADIYTPDEPATPEKPDVVATTAHAVPISDPLFPTEAELDFYSLHLIDRFCAYDISEIGFSRHTQASFFARELSRLLLETDNSPRTEQDAAEIVP